jgi:hypothetical protein
MILMEIDPMREIRKIRRQISEECGNDPEKVFDYYQSRQEQLKVTGKYTFVTTPLAIVPAKLATEQNDAPERE